MMINNNISLDILLMGCKQMGATDIDSNSTKLHIIKFKISEELTVSYLCNAKDEEKIFLQRVEPYPIRNTQFESVENILKFIKKDVLLFKNAAKSRNFKIFLDIVNKNYLIRRNIEDLFLFHNVDREFLEKVWANVNNMLEKIDQEYEDARELEIDVDVEALKIK